MAQSSANHSLLKFRFGLKQRIGVYERLAAFLDAGININDALLFIRKRYEKNKDFRRLIFTDWLETLRSGHSLADAIQKWVPPSEAMLISAGLRSGNPVQGLRDATALSTSAKAIRGAVIGGAAMPTFLFLMLAVMMMKFHTSMVPIFAKMLPISRWGTSAQALNALSSAISNYWFPIAIVVIIGAVATGLTIGKWKGPLRNIADHFPPWSIYRTANASSFMIGLASLMKSGVADYDALKIIHDMSSPWMKWHISRMLRAMQKGGINTGAALNTGLLDKETAGDAEDYSQANQFEEAIYVLGARSMHESVKKIEMKMGAIRGLMLVAVGASMLWIYATVYLLENVIAASVKG